MSGREAQAVGTARARRVFHLLLLALGAVGCLFLALGLLKPHQTGVVLRVPPVSSYSYRTGMGRHALKGGRYAADVKVRVRDTGETVTVYYRVSDPDRIPAVGEEVEFAGSLVGYEPYPQMWEVYLGFALLGLALAARMVEWIISRRKRRREDASEAT